jgi:uncharacterized protein YoaH (UPF0181 family)
MALDISRIPPKGSIGYKYFRANITSAERAELDAYEAKMAATPKKDTGTKQSTSTNASANDYFDFLGDDYSGFDYVAPPLSQTDAFKEWQATVNTDRGSDEYSLQRYPDQDEFFLGEMAIPAWFPESYSAYRKAGGLSGGIAYNNPNPEFGAPRLIEESRNSAEENLAKFTQTLIENGGAGNLGNIDFDNLDSMLAALQDTPFDLDALLADTKSFGGQTISEQEWFSPEREEIVRKFFEGQSNDPLDRGSLIKGQTWEEAKTALARGVDPDSVFAELNTLSNKSHDDFAAMEFDVTDVNRMAGPQQAFRDLSDAHFIETFNTFNNELDTLRQEDPDAFQAAYEFLPVSERLNYLYGVQKAGGITNEQYEDMYMSEVNSYAEDTQDPLAPRYVKIGNKNYLYKPSAAEPDNLDVQRDLYDTNFYPDEGSITPRRSIRTDDFDDSAFDFFDPIVSVVTPFFPIVGAAYTAIKGLSGETLHVSDWLRAVPFAVEQINLATGGTENITTGRVEGGAIPTTLGEVGDVIGRSMGSFADIPITYGAASMGALATSPMFFGQSTPIADIIKIGGLVLGQGGGTPTVPGQSGTWGGIPNSVIVNFTQQMDASGVPIPEGAFEVDPETGMFTNSSGQLVDFADAFGELIDIFRQEDPQEFALAVAGEDADPSLREIVGAATYNVAKQLVDYVGTDEDSARQQVLATILSGTSQMINNANGAIQFGETHPDNTELAKLSRNLSNLSDASNTTAVKEGMEALREYNDAFQAKEYFEPTTAEEYRASALYKAEVMKNGEAAAEEWLKDQIEGANFLNSAINGTVKFFGGLKEAPEAALAELGSEIVEEVPNLAASFMAKSGVGALLKSATAVGKKVDVKDLTDDVLEAINKAENFAGLATSTALDLAEAIGGSASEGFNSTLDTLRKVQAEEIIASAEFKAYKQSLGSQVQAGTLTAEQYRAEAEKYVQDKVMANDEANREIAVGVSTDAGVAGGLAMAASQLVFGDAVDQRILTKAFGKKADLVKEIGEGFVEQAKDWATRTGRSMAGGASAVFKEFLGEFGEEGAVSAVINTRLSAIDPTIDVAQEATGDAWFGGVLGLGVSSALLTGNYFADILKDAGLEDSLSVDNGNQWITDAANSTYVDVEGDLASRMLANYNEDINTAMQTNPDGTAVLTEQGIKDVFASAGLDPEEFPRSYATLMNHAYDGNYTSSSEANAAFDAAGYTPSQEEIDAYIGDNYGDDALGQAIDDYVDPRQTTLSEVEEYARAAGVELSDAQLQSLVGQYDNPQDDTDRLIRLISSDTDLNDLFNLGTGDPDPITGDPDPITGDPDPITGDPDPITGDPDPDLVDSDGDGIPDIYDSYPDDPENVDRTADADGDGIPDFEDEYPNDPDNVDRTADTDGDGIPDYIDEFPDDPENVDRTADRDGDGIPDFEDEYPNDPDNVDRTADTDGDGIPDYVDEYPDDPENVDRTADADGDGIPDFEDEYPLDPENIDRITDSDDDGVPDYIDEFPDDPDNIDKDAILDAIAANEEAGLSRDEAIKKAIDDVAADLGTTKSDLLAAIGETEESLLEAIGGVSAAVDLNAEAIAGAQEGIDELIAAGLTRDEAIAAVAEQLGTTEESLLEAIGGVSAAVDLNAEAIAGAQEGIDELIAAGLTRDEAIAAVAEQLGTTEENMLAALGETEESLITRFDEGMADLGLDIEAVASYVGKPPQDVTQTDIDFIADVIAQQEVLEDPTSFVPTDQQLQYDVNNDGVIDINDQLMLEQAFSGQDVALGGQFASTGLYAYNDQIAAEQAIAAEQQFETEQQLAQDRQTQLQTQMTQQQGFDQLDRTVRDMAALEAAQQRVATTQQKGVAEIDYLYDIGGESVFATPQQQSLFASPYARGGEVKNSTDRLLKIIGED